MVDEGGVDRIYGISGLTGFGSRGGDEARRAEVGDGRKIGTTKDTKGGGALNVER